MVRTITVVQDTREQRPLTFPEHLVTMASDQLGKPVTVRVQVVKQTLETGDYLLRGFETHTIIERKGSLDEIATNCLNRTDRARFTKCCVRLAGSCRDPWVFLEGCPTSLLGRDIVARSGALGGVAVDALLRLLDSHGIGLMLLPCGTSNQRRAAGEWVLRKLLSGALATPEPRVVQVGPQMDLPSGGIEGGTSRVP